MNLSITDKNLFLTSYDNLILERKLRIDVSPRPTAESYESAIKLIWRLPWVHSEPHNMSCNEVLERYELGDPGSSEKAAWLFPQHLEQAVLLPSGGPQERNRRHRFK